jgi:hypothetical protein
MGVLASARLTVMDGAVPTFAAAYVLMIAAELEATKAESIFVFQMLLSGKIGHPPIVLT